MIDFGAGGFPEQELRQGSCLVSPDLVDGSFFLFPYGHLDMVRLERHGESDLLNLSFARHDIAIAGKHLRELGLAFQKLAVDWVRESPARYAALANSDSAHITSIKVNELQAR